MNELRQFVERFRTAIEEAKRESGSELSWLERFPNDCCDTVSRLLFLFLYDAGFRGFHWVVARIEEDGKHVWLELGTFVIDITADQFPEIQTGCIVAQTSEWHSRREIIERYPVGAAANETEDAYFQRITKVEPISESYNAIMRHYSNT